VCTAGGPRDDQTAAPAAHSHSTLHSLVQSLTATTATPNWCAQVKTGHVPSSAPLTDWVSMPAVPITGPTVVMQNLPFLAIAVAVTIASIRFAYPCRDGQADVVNHSINPGFLKWPK